MESPVNGFYSAIIPPHSTLMLHAPEGNMCILFGTLIFHDDIQGQYNQEKHCNTHTLLLLPPEKIPIIPMSFQSKALSIIHTLHSIFYKNDLLYHYIVFYILSLYLPVFPIQQEILFLTNLLS